MRGAMTLAQRQAKVGILANPVPIKLPAHQPRDLLVRWPRLQSRRRLQAQMGHVAGFIQDEPETPDLSDLRAAWCESGNRSWIWPWRGN
jgi:hypothetical protein